MFNHDLWQKMRARYGGNGGNGTAAAFPTVYEKTRPEVKWKSWLEEEEVVAATAAKRQ
jgi:hypothetical protein|eukprot:COSAG02_NODE_5193_length_4551_cov_21.421833_6_plen_58_part_00